MLIKLFGVLDLLTAIVFLINNNFDKAHNWFPNSIVLILAVYLLLKGIFFVLILDFASLIDIICAVIILISLYIWITPILAFLVIIFLAQKGIFSLAQ